MGSLKDGAVADVTVFDPESEWVVDSDKFVSRGNNSPFHGTTLTGQVIATLVGGEIVYAPNSHEMNEG
jgi:dihydroorotase